MNIFSYLIIILYLCCLERTTGEPLPLDERFFKDVTSSPFVTKSQEFVTISGVIQSDISMSIDLDIRTPDISVEGGMKSQEKIIIKEIGDFSIEIPKNIGAIELQVFQDMLGDGPSKDDPFSQLTLTVRDKSIESLNIQLIKGTRNHTSPQESVQQGQAKSQKSNFDVGRPNGGRPGQHVDNPFEQYDGKTIYVSGRIICHPCDIVDLDLFEPSAEQSGGRKMLGKIKVSGDEKAFSFDVPTAFGPIILEAFVDVAGDGPSSGDLMGVYLENPLQVGADDIDGIIIELHVSEDAQIPSQTSNQ